VASPLRRLSTIDLVFEADIHASAETVFAILVDLRHYDRWLPTSDAFHGTTEISEGPITVGTTYVEHSPSGTRAGRVTELVAPTRVAFEQPMTMKPRALGTIGIRLGHTLTPGDGSVHVRRTLELALPVQLRLARPVVRRQFVAENERMMKALQAFAEASGT
jgi:uncharacterized protein YndB with AHSA1/START domain